MMKTMGILLALEQCQMTYNLGKYNAAIAAAMELIQQQGERLAAYENTAADQEWIHVAEGMPEERQSVVPGLGTVSKPVLVTWMDPTSDKPYPDNSFVREGITRNGEFTLHHINGDLVPVAWMPLPQPYEPKEASECSK